MQRVLITGAGGGIGRSLRETLRGVYPVLRLSDVVPLERRREPGRRSITPNFPTWPQSSASSPMSTASSIWAASRARASGRADPSSEHHRHIQPVRGGATSPGQAHHRRHQQPCGRVLSARPDRSTTGWCRGPTAATASARPSPRRSPASTPTSTGSAFCARGSAILERSRSTSAGCRSGSAHATTPSSCASGSSIPTSATKSSTASRTTGAPGTTIPTPSGSAIGRRTIPSPLPRRCWRPKPASAPTRSPSDYQGGTFCAAEYTADAPRP